MQPVIAVIDGMGGGIGAQLVERIRKGSLAGVSLIALGTNAAATQRMLDAGADRGASGENAIRITAGSADFILGPIGIVLPDAMMGEVTPAIAEAVSVSRAKKLLLPVNQPHFALVGLKALNLGELIDETVATLARWISGAD